MSLPTMGGLIGVGTFFNGGDDQSGPLGPRWTHSWAIRCEGDATVTFYEVGGKRRTFTRNVDGSYTAEPGVHDKLTVTRDGQGNITQYLITRPSQAKLYFWGVTYGAKSGKIDYTLFHNVTQQCSYDGSAKLTQVTTTAGGTERGRLTVGYDGSGRITSFCKVRGQNQRCMSIAYDGYGRPSQMTTPSSKVYAFTYDANNWIASASYPGGHSWSFSYTDHGNVIGAAAPGGAISASGYGTGTTAIVDARGYTWSDSYDGAGNLVAVVDALGQTTYYGYDANHNRTSVTTPRGYTWTYTYDGNRNMLTATNPLGKTTTYTYDANNNLTSVTDPKSHVTTYTYDPNTGDMTRVTDPNGYQTNYTYDSYGNMTSVTDARNNTTTYQYDDNGNMTRITDPLSYQTNFTYDDWGNRTSVTDARGNTTSFLYDDDDRMTRITYPGGAYRTFTYDCCQLTSLTDELGRTTTYQYYNTGKLWKVTDALGNVTEYQYDNNGNMTWVKNARGYYTYYVYDTANRLTQGDYPDSTHEYFGYDADGNRTSWTKADGNVIYYTYDQAGRLTGIDYPPNGGSADVSFAYDDESRRTSMTDATGVSRYYYDEYPQPNPTYVYKDALVAASYQPTGGTERVFKYEYDAVGNRTKITDPASNVTTYAYSNRNALSSMTFSGLSASYTYDQVGNRTQVTYPNGAYTAYAYNSRNWVTSVTSKNSSNQVICSYSYTNYDNVGNPLHMVEEDNSYTDWAYDNIYRLTSDVKTGGTAYSRTFTYDAVGNRTQMVKDQQTINYTYDANNKMTAAGGDSFTYDSNGNTIGRTGSSGSATWGYDYENRMTSSTTPQGSATFVYNGGGLRVRKVEGAYTGNYLYDGVRVYAKYDDNWNEAARFMIEGDSYYDPLVATRTGGAWYYPLYDSLGSTRRLINASQTVTDSYSYEAFGGITSQSGSTYNPYKYVGSLGYYSADATTGLQHLGARYYSPSAGRFTTTDPLRFPPGQYVYTANGPLLDGDPAGLGLRDRLACFFLDGVHCLTPQEKLMKGQADKLLNQVGEACEGARKAGNLAQGLNLIGKAWGCKSRFPSGELKTFMKKPAVPGDCMEFCLAVKQWLGSCLPKGDLAMLISKYSCYSECKGHE